MGENGRRLAMGHNVLRTMLCDLLGIDYPIILAGMWVRDGRATPPPLVAAVSNAGGMGVMAGLGLEPEELRRRIREVRELTSKPFGVDLLLPARLEDVVEERHQVRERLRREHPRQADFAHGLMQKYELPSVEETAPAELSPPLMKRQVEVAVDERVPALAVALGDSRWAVSLAHAQGIKVIGLAGSLRNAVRQKEAGVDIIVAQGYEAGGHTGTVATLPLVPQVVDAVFPTPVVAAGGIADGRGLVASLALGAVGVWCGTAFLLAEESGVWQTHKEQILAATSEDFTVTRCYTGKTARDYRNPVIADWEDSDVEPLPMPLQWMLMDDFVAAADAAGRAELINNPCGQVAGMLRQIRPARQIVEEMVSGALEVYRRHDREVLRSA